MSNATVQNPNTATLTEKSAKGEIITMIALDFFNGDATAVYEAAKLHGNRSYKKTFFKLLSKLQADQKVAQTVEPVAETPATPANNNNKTTEDDRALLVDLFDTENTELWAVPGSPAKTVSAKVHQRSMMGDLSRETITPLFWKLAAKIHAMFTADSIPTMRAVKATAKRAKARFMAEVVRLDLAEYKATVTRFNWESLGLGLQS